MIDLTWTIIEISVNVFQGILDAYFIYKYLGIKNNIRKKVFFTTTAGFQALLITVLNYFTIFESVATFLYFFELFLCAVIMLNGNIIKKIFTSMLPLFMGFIITTAVLNFLSSINKMSIAELVTNKGAIRLITLLSIQALYFISFKLLLKLFHTDSDFFGLQEWGVAIAVMISSIVISALLHMVAIQSTNYSQRLYINIAFLIMLVLNILVYILIDSLLKKNSLQNQVEKLTLQEQYQQQYLDNATVQYDSMRKIKHYVKNQISTIYTLLSNQNIDEAMDFIKKYQSVISKSETVVHTSNNIANAIINSKLTSATALGIRVSCLSTLNFDGIDDIDLCNLLCNALDNALEACMNQSTNIDRFISLEISCENDIYTFYINNSTDKNVLKNNPNLESTKKDKKNHGLGTKILEDIARKYNGRCDFFEIQNTFCCQIILLKSSLD